MATIRVVIEDIEPQVDGGSATVRRVKGEEVKVEVRIFTDGHDQIDGALLFKSAKSNTWQTLPLEPLANDLWRARFEVQELGQYEYTVCAWVDAARTWQRDFKKRYAAAQDTDVDFVLGAQQAVALALRVPKADARRLTAWANALTDAKRSREERAALAASDILSDYAHRYPDPDLVLRHEPPLKVDVERERARFSTWYELFPRSTSPTPGVHGTFADCEARLPYVAAMGFDVLYLPPIHPIGMTERKGANNRVAAGVNDVGSPWAIGADAGGHKAVHPQLGTLEDFRRLVAKTAAWRSRSTWPFSAAPIILMCTSTPSGFCTARTAASNMRKTRRRNTRTSILSILTARRGVSCGRSSRASLNIGSRRACASSVWTIPTPSLSHSGNG